MNEKLKFTRTDYRVITMALNAVAELEDGEYPFDTDAGEMIVNKKTSDAGTVRRNIYHKGSRIKVIDARTLLRETPVQQVNDEVDEEDKEKENNVGGCLTASQLEKKYKCKKVLKALQKWDGLKKKKLAKAVAGFEKIAEKKMTGNEVLSHLATIKDDIKAAKLVTLFELL